MNEQPNTIVLKFPARPEYLIVCRLALNGLADAAPLGDEALSDLKLAVTEACANSIAHAYGDEGGPITMRIDVEDGAVRIEIADDGAGMTAPPPDTDGDGNGVLEGGGMGIRLIRALVDELDISTGDQRGTRLVMTKQLAAPSPG